MKSFGSFIFQLLVLATLAMSVSSSRTKTVFTTTTSTTTSVKSCIDASQFETGATNTCARRRRSLMEIEEIEAIEPAEIEPLEPSVAPALITSSRDDLPELRSSQEDTSGEKTKRVVTRTTTSYSFSTFTWTGSFTLLTTGHLLCVPAGYTIC